MALRDIFPFLDLRDLKPAAIPRELMASLSVTFLAVPQGVAYAMIADLPPVMGLYASVLPTLVGSLFRSSRHVITGPSNALSLLVGGAVAASAGVDPVLLVVTLAAMVGILQVAAGVLGLSAVVDYISRPVILGYITGAALLIGVGQLHHFTGTPGTRGDPFTRIEGWISGLGGISYMALAIGLGTVALILLVQRIHRRLPAPMLGVALITALSVILDLPGQGLKILGDVSPVPQGLPQLTVPDLSLISLLFPFAVATTVLSLVESSAVGRSISSRSGQRLNPSMEFVGQGMANVAAAFSGGYPVSGSLARSAINEGAGATSRLSGILCGIWMLGVLVFFGDLVNRVPVAAVSGLLLVVAWRLIDKVKIRRVFSAGLADILAFSVTLVGTWFLTLDKAIYLGVGLSLIFFLRQARLLTVTELGVNPLGRLRELGDASLGLTPREDRCPALRIAQVEGRLFFGVEGELRRALDYYIQDPALKVLVLRVKRTRGLDFSISSVLLETLERMNEKGQELILVGMRPETMEKLEDAGLVQALGSEQVYPSKAQWFKAMREALQRAVELAGPDCDGCLSLHAYLERTTVEEIRRRSLESQ